MKKHETPTEITKILNADPILKAIYDVVLVARTEGIIGGKTKWLALSDAETIKEIKQG